MKPNLRILCFVAALVVTITAGVTLVHPSSIDFSEKIAWHGVSSGDRQASGLLLHIDKKGLSFLIPNCELDTFKDRFFMHVYPVAPANKVADNFINQDFDLSKELVRRIFSGTGQDCMITRSFGTAHPKEIIIGQLAMTDDQHYQIIWSRTYVIK